MIKSGQFGVGALSYFPRNIETLSSVPRNVGALSSAPRNIGPLNSVVLESGISLEDRETTPYAQETKYEKDEIYATIAVSKPTQRGLREV